MTYPYHIEHLYFTYNSTYVFTSLRCNCGQERTFHELEPVFCFVFGQGLVARKYEYNLVQNKLKAQIFFIMYYSERVCNVKVSFVFN